MSKKFKVVLVFGTRPEAIKMAPVIIELKSQQNIETVICVTAQHRKLLDDALQVFKIVPDFDLDLMQPGQVLAATNAAVLLNLSPLLSDIKPDRVLVHGDTTTTFSAAITSFYLGMPVGHVEAGLRTGNLSAPWPEEFNRRCVDMISDLLWAPTTAAATALEREGSLPENIFITGNTGIDALRIVKARMESDQKLRLFVEDKLRQLVVDKKTILVTGHRRENFEGGFHVLCEALNRLAARSDVQIVWPIHPNPNVVSTVRSELKIRNNIFLIEPLNYLTFVALMMKSYMIITDSGGIQEEAPTLSKPVLVTRDETERGEAISAGTAKLVGMTSVNRIVLAAEKLLDDPVFYASVAERTNPFGDGFAASRIVRSLMSRHS